LKDWERNPHSPLPEKVGKYRVGPGWSGRRKEPNIKGSPGIRESRNKDRYVNPFSL
jgi:hypothetical protein